MATNKRCAADRLCERMPILQCGIVYCLARNECERVAEDLEVRGSSPGG